MNNRLNASGLTRSSLIFYHYRNLQLLEVASSYSSSHFQLCKSFSKELSDFFFKPAVFSSSLYWWQGFKNTPLFSLCKSLCKLFSDFLQTRFLAPPLYWRQGFKNTPLFLLCKQHFKNFSDFFNQHFLPLSLPDSGKALKILNPQLYTNHFPFIFEFFLLQPHFSVSQRTRIKPQKPLNSFTAQHKPT